MISDRSDLRIFIMVFYFRYLFHSGVGPPRLG
jgi:hypothetical protein